MDVVERPRIVSELDSLEPRERRVRRLVVPLDRRRLAEAGHTAVADLDLHHLRDVVRLARDHERLREPEPHEVGAQPPSAVR